jgi:hypothetical protein
VNFVQEEARERRRRGRQKNPALIPSARSGTPSMLTSVPRSPKSQDQVVYVHYISSLQCRPPDTLHMVSIIKYAMNGIISPIVTCTGFEECQPDEKGQRRVRCLPCSQQQKHDIIILNKSRSSHERNSTAHQRALRDYNATSAPLGLPMVLSAQRAVQTPMRVPSQLLRTETQNQSVSYRQDQQHTNPFAGHYMVDGQMFDPNGELVGFEDKIATARDASESLDILDLNDVSDEYLDHDNGAFDCELEGVKRDSMQLTWLTPTLCVHSTQLG